VSYLFSLNSVISHFVIQNIIFTKRSGRNKQTLLISSKTKDDIELLTNLVRKMGLKAKLLSENDREDIGLL